jgi:hypothetical protein
VTLAQKLPQTYEPAAVAPVVAPEPKAFEPKGFKGELVRVASIYTLEGRLVTSGVATLTGTSSEWTATLAKLDRPGMVAALFFSEGLREVRLRLDDGRSARARITGTTFVASAERVCDLASLEPLA